MHKLAKLSEAERRRLVDGFLTAAFGGVGTDSTFAGITRSMTPELPDDPDTEQVQAWVELAELSQDPDFRGYVRHLAEGQAAEAAQGGPPTLHRDLAATVRDQIAPALAAGIDPASPLADPFVSDLMSRCARFLDCQGDAESRQQLLSRLESINDPRRERYLQLLAVVNGWPAPESLQPVLDWSVEALEARMLRVIGAGLGRTGTNSLKVALERLLDAPCYHMLEVQRRLTDAQVWLDALHGRPAGLRELLSDYAATVDWPAAALWQWLAKEHPDAVVLLSLRDDAATWLRSARATIMPVAEPDWHDDPDWASMREMDEAMFAAFDPHWRDDAAAKAAYDRHVETVRREVAPERLVEWRPGDGWEPLCTALGVPVPNEPFPHVNSTAEFTARSAARGPHLMPGSPNG